MNKEICETKIVWVSNSLVEIYQLIAVDGKYSIICDEKNIATTELSEEIVDNITEDKNLAYKLFEIIIKNGVCEGTVKDVIQDLMC